MSGDSNFDNVSLLLPFDGPNGSTTHLDRSPVGKTITNSVGSLVSSAQSKFNGVSLSLNGVNDNLSTASHTDFNFGTGDFTIELWVYGTRTNQPHSFPRILTNGAYLASGAWHLVLIASSGALFFDTYNGSAADGFSIGTLPENQWSHIAIARQSGTLRVFLNGTVVTARANSQNLTGAYSTNIGSDTISFFKGYIDDLRITKGVARYTATFTPPTEPNPIGYVTVLDPSYSNVSLLVNADGSALVDESPSPKTLTTFGNATLSKVNSRVGAGSLLFDGTGDYLTTPDASDLRIVGSDFTIEAWVYTSVNNTVKYIVRKGTSTYAAGFAFGLNPSGKVFISIGVTSTDEVFLGASTIPINTWTHVAATKSGPTVRVFVNGVVDATGTVAGTPADNAEILHIGRDPADTTRDWSGYIDALRITKGVARYTTNFTPPNYVLAAHSPTPAQLGISLQGQIPIFPIAFEDVASQNTINLSGHSPIVNTAGGDVYFSNVVLLLPFDDSNGSTAFTDYSLYTRAVTPFGNAQVSTVQSKFGGASAKFDGTGDYLSTPDATELHITSGDFTIEAWVYRASDTSPNVIVLKGIALSVSEYTLFVGSNGYINFGIGVGANQSWFYSTSYSLPTSSWKHIAVTKSGSTIRIFVDGTQISLNSGETLSTPTETTTYPLYIGRDTNNPDYDWDGYIDDLRITKGVARYTSSFTPPSDPNPITPPAGLLYPTQAPITIFGQVPFYDNGLSINLIDSITIPTSINNTLLLNILESLLIDKLIPTSFNVKNSLEDTFRLSELLSATFKEVIPDILSAYDATGEVLYKIERVLDLITKLEDVNSNVNYSSTIIDLISIFDDLLKRMGADVIEAMILTESIALLYSLHSLILESQGYTDTSSASYVNILSLSDSLSTLDSSNSLAILKALSEDSFIIELPKDTTGTYLAYLLSPETNSVSTYNNYNFNGCTKFNYKYLFYNKTGLYEYGGSTDNGSSIRSEIETVAFNFQTSNLKQVPSIYLGVDSTDKVILKVRVDGKAEVLYQLNKFTNNLMTQKIDIGKGLIGRYFQFELITEASEFNMESIEFYPLEIRRKL